MKAKTKTIEVDVLKFDGKNFEEVKKQLENLGCEVKEQVCYSNVGMSVDFKRFNVHKHSSLYYHGSMFVNQHWVFQEGFNPEPVSTKDFERLYEFIEETKPSVDSNEEITN